MGRIKTSLVKRFSKELFRVHREELTTDFAQNKELLNTVSNMPSKKIRNVVAGYVTRMARLEQAGREV